MAPPGCFERCATRCGWLCHGRGHRAVGARGHRRGGHVDRFRRPRARRADGPALSAGVPSAWSACATWAWTARCTQRSIPTRAGASASLGAAAIGATARSPRWRRCAPALPWSSTSGSPACTSRLATRRRLARRARGPAPGQRAHPTGPCALRIARRARRRAPGGTRPRAGLGRARDPILRWVTELATRGLEISGDDLIAAGVPRAGDRPALRRDVAA